MNLCKYKKTGSLKGRLKRMLALVMAVLMMVTTPAPGLSLVSHADSDLTPMVLSSWGGGLATAYKYTGRTDNPSGTLKSNAKFEIEGITDASLIGTANPFTGDRDKSIETTYLGSGFGTFVRAYNGSQNAGATLTIPGGSEYVNLYDNGGVQQFNEATSSKDLGIAVQMKLSNSDDKKWVIVEYLVHNNRNSENDIQLGTTADIKLGGTNQDPPAPPGDDPADGSKLVVNTRGIHMVNKKTQQTFECMFNYPELYLTLPDHMWVGNRSEAGRNLYTDWNHTAPESPEVEKQDSALAYSWNIRLQPNQTVTKRIAFGVKGPSYYVSNSGDDTHDGTYATPVKTIEQAIKLIKNNPAGGSTTANKSVFIYMQSDYTVNQTIEMPKGYNVTILSTDYDTDGLPVDIIDIRTIKRGPNLKNGPMFGVSSGGDLRVGSLTLDGGSIADNTGPILSASHGTLSITSGATLQNNQVTASDMGSAVNVTGDANLDISYGLVTGNKTADRGAVNFNSTGQFTVSGSCDIENNTNTAGDNANVYLPAGKWITVKDTPPTDEPPARIGVTAEQVPAASFKDQPVTDAGQEVKVAVPLKGSKVDKTSSTPPSSLFFGNFFLDKGLGGGAVPYLAVGTANFPDASAHNERNTVLRRDGLAMNFLITTKDGDPPITDPTKTPAPLPFAAGDPVTTPAAPEITSYKLDETKIEQGGTSTLQAAGPTDINPGAITGTMPGQAVTVTYVYRRMKAQISLVTNGGMTDDGKTEIPALQGSTGKPVPHGPNGPVLHKEGYTFLGWSEQNNGPGSPISWPAVYPDSEVTMYAIFQPDSTLKYDYTKEYTYTDKKGTVVFKTDSTPNAHSVEDRLDKITAIKVAGYLWDPASSSTNPPFWPVGSATPVGQFDGSGNFTGKMPAKNLTVHFGYKPDPMKTYPLTVNYVSNGGTVLRTQDLPPNVAGTPVRIAPPDTISHYKLSSGRIDKGTTGSETSDGLVIGVQKPPTAANNYVWDDRMPNQDVELTYVYTGDGTSFGITENYVDDTATDPELKNIIKTPPNQHPIDESVSGTYQSPYGYTEVPAGRSITTTSLTPSNIAFKTGTDVNQWSGAMPAGDVVITYHHTRTAGKWADLTYKPGKNGTLAKDGTTSSDVASDGGDGYKASILLHGADDTKNAGYTLQMIEDKHLAPAANQSTHYSFEGWFVDTAGDGVRDNGEALVPADRTFTQAATLTASFVKITAEWMDVHFTTEKGSYVSGDQNQNIPKGTTWSQMSSLPVYSEWPYYEEDGWYTKDAGNTYTRVDENTVLTEGQTYIHRFKPSTDKTKQFDYQVDYSSSTGGNKPVLVFKTIDPEKHSIEDTVTAEKFNVPGYTWVKTASTADPASYTDPSGHATSTGSFDDAGNFIDGKMPGQNLTVHYKYQVAQTEYTLTVKYLSANNVPVADPRTKPLKPETDFVTDPEEVTGYTCTGFEFETGDKPGDMIAAAPGEPDKDNKYHWLSNMPNQDVTLVYKYVGNQSKTYTLTERYMDTGSGDAGLQEISHSTWKQPLHADDRVDGQYQAPIGYEPDPAKPSTVEPAGTTIAFTSQDSGVWGGFMPNKDVTITYYNKRIPYDPQKPETHYWGTLTYLPGENGSLSPGAEGEVSKDVKPAEGGGYTAGILLNNAQTPRPEAYTWKMITDKKLVPVPVPKDANLYSFTGWFVDGNHNGIMDNGEAVVSGTQTFTGDTTLTASFKKEKGAWININFDAKNGTLNSGSIQTLNIPRSYQWKDIKSQLPDYTPWENYTKDGWYLGDVRMTDNMELKDKSTYTAVSKPDPGKTFQYTVTYTNEDGSIVFDTIADDVKHPVMYPVTATLKSVPGYEWDQKGSTDPAAYPFDPNVGETKIGDFGSDGAFIGKMPGQNLTVRYKYNLKADAKFNLTVRYETETGVKLHGTRGPESFHPGDDITTGPEPVDGYKCSGFRFEHGKTHGSGGSLLLPVKGEPDPNQGYQWTSKMTNQDVTLVYLYKGDESAHNTITERYLDINAADGLKDIILPVTNSYQVGVAVSGTYQDLYGYEKTGKPVLTMEQSWDGDKTITIGDDGNWSGTMLPRDVVITYSYKRATINPDQPDKDHPWADLTYLPGINGSLNRDGGVSSDVKDYNYQSGGTTVHGYKAGILLDNGTQGALNQPYTFGYIKTKKLIPNPEAATYYKPEGWFADKNGNGVRDTSADPTVNEPLLTDDTKTFSIDSTTAERTLTASFVEDTYKWIDITFAGEHAALNESGPTSLHIQYDRRWKDITASLPAYTLEVNYLLDGWYDTTDPANIVKMDPDTQLYDSHTYTIIGTQNPEIFGTDVETPNASGGLDGQGKGRITIYDTREGLYQYILTDLDGTILTVVPKRSISQRVEFSGLQPGSRYHVYEAVRSLAALPGGQIAGLGEEGTAISPAAEVLIPVLADNYQVYYNDENTDETVTRLLIRPADPDSDYAVLNSQGQVVQTPGAQEGGWVTSLNGSPSIEVPGLAYGEEYTVVARPRGRTGITAESKKEDGTVITAAPIGDLALNSYIITTTQGEILKVGTAQVEGTGYKEAHKGDLVTVSAPGTNQAGESFVRWDTTIGILDGQSIDLTQPELSFTMPAANLVLTPVYNHNSAPNASAAGEVRGGNKKEIALDPNEIPGMEQNLTQKKDQELISQNGADVTYKVIYKKSGVKSREVALIRDSEDYPGHNGAFHTAWGLNVSMERLVNGRKVDLASPSDAARDTEPEPVPPVMPSEPMLPGSPSDAAKAKGLTKTAAAATPSEASQTVSFDNSVSYRTYIQMGRSDVDMLDYQLYEIKRDDTGTLYAELVPVRSAAVADNPDSRDVSDTPDVADKEGGLFVFDATPGSRYVMVYSRAYRLYFTNELPILDAPQYYHFKVRQNENPEMSDYSDEYGEIPVPPSGILNPGTGAIYNSQGWSYKRDSLKKFNPSRLIKNTTHVYAYYTDNEKQVAEERAKLQQTIDAAWKLSEDPFMKRQDSKSLKAEIEAAREVLQQENPRAEEEALRAANNKLRDQMKHYQDLLNAVHDEYEEIKGGSSGGGSGGGGGGGQGIRKDPFSAEPVKSYTVGNNGDWKVVSEVPGQNKKWAFVLNGGYRLKSMWAYLKYPEVTNSAAGWYHFNSDAIMDTGWFKDEAGKWYYSYKLNEGPEGKMATGWHLDTADGHWYYLDPVNGSMVTGWKQIDGKWYDLETVGTGAYVYNTDTEEWIFGGGAGHPLGSMYQNERTPDGYMVDVNGVWIQ